MKSEPSLKGKSFIAFIFLLIALPVFCQFGDQHPLTYANNTPSDIFNIDLDLDGDQDILTSAKHDAKICWYENDGGGAFNTEHRIGNSAIGAVTDVHTADLDGDGDLDILGCTESNGSKVMWFENLGSMVFSQAIIISTAVSWAQSVTTADLDYDGDLDIISASSVDKKIAWYSNFGGGNFGPQQVISNQADGANCVITTDLNGDGYQDIVATCNNDDDIIWFINSGTGTFSTAQIIDAGANGIRNAFAGDIDNDGDMDICAASANTFVSEIAWYVNSGTGTFSPAQILSAPASNSPREAKTTDLDNDGDLDIAVADMENGILFYENLGGGTFSPFQIINSSANGPIRLDFADFNNDGLKDLCFAGFTINPNTNEIAWSDQISNLTFSQRKLLTTEAHVAAQVSSADIDGDGDQDILSASESDDKIAWYRNIDGFHFAPQEIITQDADYASVVYAADMDGDTDLDILFTNSQQNRLSWQENTGSGTFGAANTITTQISGGSAGFSLASTDIDGDGDEDVFSGSWIDNKIAWYENLGSGVFGPQQIINSQATGCRTIQLADLNGDGNEDIVAAAATIGKIVWHENLGNGVFGTQQFAASNITGLRAIDITDIDNDGDQDIAAVSSTVSKVMWFENSGNGSFIIQHLLAVDLSQANAIHCADIDNDNDQDILAVSVGLTINDLAVWYENLGDRLFSTGQVISDQIDGGTSIYTTDLDADGDLEILTSSKYDDEIAWYENYIIHDNQVAGKLFIDVNVNQVSDASDLSFSQIGITSIPIASHSHLYADGRYFFVYDDTLVTHTLVPGTLNNWGLVTDSATYTIPVNTPFNSITGLDFGFYPNILNDSIITDLTGGFPRCNDTINYWLSFSNAGTSITSGIIQLHLDDSVTFIGSNISPDSIVGSIVYWSYDSLLFFSTEQINVFVLMPDFNSINDTCTSTFSVNALDAFGNIYYTSTDSLSQVLLCAYDPNDKTVVPTGIDAPGYIPMETTSLEYVVRFQNTGNDTANVVIIRDQLDPDLDWNTFSIVASSHSVYHTLNATGEISFIFSDIMLPDSNVNYLGSQGFVKYRIHLEPGLQHGTVITNVANIYFDQNPAVITNTTTNTLYDCSNLLSFSSFQNNYCDGETVYASGELSTTFFNWEINSTEIGAGHELLWLPDTSGVHTIFFEVTNGLCFADSSISFTVLDPVSVNFLSIVNICPGDSSFVFNHYQSQAGVFYDTLQNAYGCDSVIAQEINLFLAPEILLDTIRTCPEIGAIIFGEQQTTQGWYSDTLQTIHGCDSILLRYLEVYPVTTITISEFQEDTVCIYGPIIPLPDGIPAGGTYSGNGIFSGQFDPLLAGFGNHVITYSYENNNLCISSDSTQIVVDDCLKMNELNSANIIVYPNPTSDHLTIETIGVEKITSIVIYTAEGKIALSSSYIHPKKNLLNVAPLPQALYFLVVQTENSETRTQIIKI